jgi:hypothetical protein
MKLVNNSKEFEELYPYCKKYLKECRYPEKYPCLIERTQEDGGLMGFYYTCEVIYPPENGTFLDGVNAKREVLIGMH